MRLTLERFAYLDTGTFGVLTLPSGVRLYTVERPWLNNAAGVSCIPEGVYPLAPRRFFRGGYDTYEVENVPGRKYILIHVANWPKDVEGCIGLGTGFLIEKNMVTSSKDAFAQFMLEMDEQSGRPAEIYIVSKSAILSV